MHPVYLFAPETVRYQPEDPCKPLDLEALFPGRADAPLEVDLGCGDGSFLLAMANRAPERNFLGVERLLGRVRRTSRGAATLGLANVRVILLESHYLVRYLLPGGCVNTFHVMFPDPWPKRRHHPRRLIQPEFLAAAARALRPGGELRLSTDDLPYFQHMRLVSQRHPAFEEAPWEPGPEYPQTDFERLFRANGLPVYRALLFARPGP